ncbi:hypothetical protein OAW18_07120 [Alphaproteobacteria bacterium]|nr:hypothetical protein [Alphaproteobacteria bacterium]
MSELQTKIETAFKDSSSKISKLGKQLDKIADLEQEMSSLSGNLQLSSNGLRKLTKDHASYLQGVDDLNSSLAEIAEILGDINPEELESRVKALEQKASDIQGQIKRSEVITTAAINRVFYFMLTTVFLGACAFIYALMVTR